MQTEKRMPFETLESAQEFVLLLLTETKTAYHEIELLIQEMDQPPRRIEALRLVSFKLSQLRKQMEASSRVLKDLLQPAQVLLDFYSAHAVHNHVGP